MSNLVTTKGEILQDPPFVQIVLNDPRSSLLWLVLRLWLGWEWISGAWRQINDPDWIQSGMALKQFWEEMIGNPQTAGWYQALLRFLYEAEAWPWFSKLVTYGELLVGIALVLGVFTGIVAFVGAFMSLNFLMAGAIGLNPIMFVVAMAIIMAWKVAGYIGVDFFLLPCLGTPWRGKPLRLLRRDLLGSKEDGG